MTVQFSAQVRTSRDYQRRPNDPLDRLAQNPSLQELLQQDDLKGVTITLHPRDQFAASYPDKGGVLRIIPRQTVQHPNGFWYHVVRAVREAMKANQN